MAMQCKEMNKYIALSENVMAGMCWCLQVCQMRRLEVKGTLILLLSYKIKFKFKQTAVIH